MIISNLFHKINNIFTKLASFDFLALLAIRCYLAPVFWMAGIQKWQNMPDTIAWFANPDWGLGLPFPTLLAYAATLTELLGAIFLMIGFATRLMSIPLMITMIVAVMTVHIDNGWYAIATDQQQAAQRLQTFLDWLSQNQPNRYRYITEFGQPVILNNGVEFAVTYLIMLLVLFFNGPGRLLSIDYWLKHKIFKSFC